MSSEKMDPRAHPDKDASQIISNAGGSTDPASAPVNNTVLFNAIEADDYEAFKACFDDLAEIISAREVANSTNHYGVSLIHSAATYDRFEIAGFLMLNGSNPDCRTSIGITPLYMATYDNPNSFKMVSLLLNNGCDINAKSIYGHFPLYNAMEERNFEVARLLIERGADVNAAVQEDGGETALHIAAKYDDDQIAQELIKSGADVNARTDENHTPVFIAALNHSEKVLKFLIENHAQTDIRTDNGTSPVDVAKGPLKQMLVTAQPGLERSPGHAESKSCLPRSEQAVTGMKRPLLFNVATACLVVSLCVLLLFFYARRQAFQPPMDQTPDEAPVIVMKAIAYPVAAPVETEAEEPVLEPVAETIAAPVAAHVAEAVQGLPEPVTAQAVSKQRPYLLIAGSFKEAANANRFMQRLKRLGLAHSAIVPRGAMTLVSIDAFAGIIDARARKKALLNDHKLETWIWVKTDN